MPQEKTILLKDDRTRRYRPEYHDPSIPNIMTLDQAMNALQKDLDESDTDVAIEWLQCLSVHGGLAEWGLLARQNQRRRASSILCRLARLTEVEVSAEQALLVLEAADRCLSLQPADRYQAASLAAFCAADTPFVRRLYRWAVSINHIELIYRLGYLAR